MSDKTYFSKINDGSRDRYVKDTEARASYESLATVAKTGSYADLNNKPSIPAAVAVKGDTESIYRTGDVNITPANIGLGNVGNFKAVSTVASQGLSDTEKANARENIGAASLTALEEILSQLSAITEGMGILSAKANEWVDAATWADNISWPTE